MRVKPDSGQESKDQEEPQEKRRLDLSVPQVAGSAIAAVVAAKLASNLGVYGTILGAGVVSGIATCGGTIFQHFFKRTGEQIRVVAVQAKPKAQQVPVPRGDQAPVTASPAVPETFRTASYPGAVSATGPVTTTWGRPQTTGATAPGGEPAATTALPGAADADPTTVMPLAADADPTASVSGAADADPTTVLPSVACDLDADRTQLLGPADATRLLPGDDATRLVPREDATRVLPVGAPASPPGVPIEPPLPSDDFTEGTTHRARIRSWKRPLIAGAVVFGVAMAGITTYELVSGKDFSGGKGTTISNLTGNDSSRKEQPSTPPTGPSGVPSDNGTSGTGDPDSPEGDGGATQDPGGAGGRTPGQGEGTGPTADPDKSTGTDTDKDDGTDSGDDGSKTDPTPTPPPAPTPSSGTGTGSGSGTGAGGDAQQGETTSP
ncbi:hypothetical protein [Streptomyces sp. NPDC023327]|uniref:hypothetical protein n=1 Tax=Streptomyces sp. NPDC023327 TaxID=3157088 RepID=UPI0033ECF4DA